MKRLFLFVLASMMFHGGLNTAEVGAQTPPAIDVNVVTNKSTYILNDASDPIEVELTIGDSSTASILTSVGKAGFGEEPFHLWLTFTDPKGNPITSPELAVKGDPPLQPEPPPPPCKFIGGICVQMEECEVFSAFPISLRCEGRDWIQRRHVEATFRTR